MSLRLTCTATDALPIELAGIVPESLRQHTRGEIERLPVLYGKGHVPLAELFRISGDAADNRMELEGPLGSVHRIGAGMAGGTIHVQGDAGRHLGAEMTGGQIHVAGSAGDWLGAEMHGGVIHVAGSAGDLCGAAYSGSRRGMTGGAVLVAGSVGSQCGHTMRRGLIVVGGDCGELPALNMLAGTIFVGGTCGVQPALGMRRGTLALLAQRVPERLPTFRSSGCCQPAFLPVYLRWLAAHRCHVPDAWRATTFELFSGDRLYGGRGEILARP